MVKGIDGANKINRTATGPQGPQGPQGIQGPQGPQGPQGDDGGNITAGAALTFTADGLNVQVDDTTIAVSDADRLRLHTSLTYPICVERSKWIPISDTSAAPTDFQLCFRNNYKSERATGPYPQLYTAEYMYEKFSYYGSDSNTWYRVSVRGAMGKSASFTQNEVLFEIGNSIAPKRQSIYTVSIIDGDGGPDSENSIGAYPISIRSKIGGTHANFSLYFINSETGDQATSHLYFNDITWDTLDTNGA